MSMTFDRGLNQGLKGIPDLQSENISIRFDQVMDALEHFAPNKLNNIHKSNELGVIAKGGDGFQLSADVPKRESTQEFNERRKHEVLDDYKDVLTKAYEEMTRGSLHKDVFALRMRQTIEMADVVGGSDLVKKFVDGLPEKVKKEMELKVDQEKVSFKVGSQEYTVGLLPSDATNGKQTPERYAALIVADRGIDGTRELEHHVQGLFLEGGKKAVDEFLQKVSDQVRQQSKGSATVEFPWSKDLKGMPIGCVGMVRRAGNVQERRALVVDEKQYSDWSKNLTD